MISNISTAINFLGIPSVVMYMEQILKKYPDHKNKIISIGSGGGYIEKLLDKLLGIDIICIDPEPLSYITDKTIYKYPKYSDVCDEKFPLSIYEDNCILFINWSTPDKTNGYDIQSILRLKPICILTTVETGFYRGSGSIGFHHFLAFNGISTYGGYCAGIDKYEKPENIDFRDYKYYTMDTTCNYKKPGFDESLNFQIIMMTKNKMLLDVKLPSVVKPYGSKENMDETDIFNVEWIPIRKRIEPIVKKIIILPANKDNADIKNNIDDNIELEMKTLF